MNEKVQNKEKVFCENCKHINHRGVYSYLEFTDILTAVCLKTERVKIIKKLDPVTGEYELTKRWIKTCRSKNRRMNCRDYEPRYLQ